jgi:hypothetical protein
MTTNMHERHLILPEEDNTIRQDIREPSDTVSGKSGSQLLLQWTEVRCRAGWTRGRRWSARHRPDTWSAGCLVDMKVDELLNDDMHFSKSALATATKCLVLYNRKSPLTTELGKRPTKSPV